MKKTFVILSMLAMSLCVQNISGTEISAGNGSDPQFTIKGQGDKMNAFAFPNPLSVNSLIAYELNSESNVTLSLFDCQGRLIEELLDERQQAGPQKFFMERGNLAAGLYFLNISAEDQVVSISIAVVD